VNFGQNNSFVAGQLIASDREKYETAQQASAGTNDIKMSNCKCNYDS